MPDGPGSLRFDAIRVDAAVVHLELPDSFALDRSVLMMGKTAKQVGAWVADNAR
jgi:hypothetical protein